MNILLLGSGGREHAIAWKLAQSSQCDKLLIAPGNPGTAQCGTNMPFGVTDFEAIKQCCQEEFIDMVIVGPEDPLVKGIVDYLKQESGLNLMIIGPSKEAAQLEGSKAYAKSFMQRHGIPTAAYREFTTENFSDGVEYLHHQPLPIVLKADGLAAGKGVIICQNHVEAVSEFELMLQRSKFGDAGKRVVVEEFLHGIEMSVFVLTDGWDYVLLPEAKDYKRVGEGDNGPNTGGMGAVSPVPFATEALWQKIITKVVEPTIKGIKEDELDYKGFVFIGLMIVDEEPFVIEYNCRMGDPETEVVMPRIKNDLVELLASAAKSELQHVKLEQDGRYAATIMAVSGGYPGEFAKGLPITGLDEVGSENTLIFQAGTAEKDGSIVTSGGRVLCVTSLADELDEALYNCRELMEKIQFEDKYYRRDIGYEFIKDLS